MPGNHHFIFTNSSYARKIGLLSYNFIQFPDDAAKYSDLM